MYDKFGWKYLLTAAIVVFSGVALSWSGINLGLDLRGGVEIIYRLDFGGQQTVSASTTEDTVKVLRERIDTLGIKELSIRSLGNDKVVIQVPSATDSEIEKIKGQIERAGKLQFKIMVTDQLSDAAKKAEIERIVREKKLGTWQPHDRYDVATWHSVRGASAAEETDAGEYALLYNYTPSGKPEFVDGQHLATAYPTMDDKGRSAVGFEWDSVGQRAFYDLTANNRGKILAVVLDGEIRSAPQIRSAIGKRGIIEGGDKGWDEKELTTLIVILKAGALPAKPILAYTKRVGAQLGAQAVEMGGIAIAGSMLAIVLFMIFYYRFRTGLVADIALVLNIFLILGTMSVFGATLTLPGIAGILLTAGMAVDANVLIFERIREEWARGAALKQAIQAGYDRAFWTIFDANLTTLLTAVVLMWVGTGPIKGFGLTLTIGIAISMFTALFVTRFVYGFFVVKDFVKTVDYRQMFPKPNIDYSRYFVPATAFSVILIVSGWLVFLYRGDEAFGIDFTGGTVLQMRLEQPLKSAEVQERIAAQFERLGKPAPQVEIQAMGEVVGGRSREWQLRTRMVEADIAQAPQGSAEQETSALLDAVLPRAHAQQQPDDTAPPAAEGEGGQPAADPAPAGEQPAPAGEQPAPAGEQPAPAGEQPASDEAEGAAAAAAERAQDYFEQAIRGAFGDILVEAYPELDGKPYETTPPENGKVRVRFKVNLVPLAKGLRVQKIDITEQLVETTLPKAFRELASRTDTKNAEGKTRQELLELLAGPAPIPGKEPVPGFEVEILPDTNAEDGLTPVLFTTAAIENAPKRVEDVVATFKEALEKVQEYEGVSFAPSQAFPNIDTVGAAVARNLQSKAIAATFFCVVFICLYIWLRFDMWSGVSAIVALAHDVLALLAFLAILDWILSVTGSTFDVKFSLITISAFLTLIGYSINDTIVILDRIREVRATTKTKEYTVEIVNDAVNSTLARTVLTSLTTFLVVFVLFAASFGGLTSIQGFSAALLFGLLIGCYSSVFVAAPLLILEPRKVFKGLGALAAFLLVTLIASKVFL